MSTADDGMVGTPTADDLRAHRAALLRRYVNDRRSMRLALKLLTRQCRSGNLAIHGGSGDERRFMEVLEVAEQVLRQGASALPATTEAGLVNAEQLEAATKRIDALEDWCTRACDAMRDLGRVGTAASKESFYRLIRELATKRGA